MLKLFFLIVLSAILQLTVEGKESLPKQGEKWFCNERKQCIKNLVSNQTSYSSQNDCRLSCGRFGSLWPRPTGNCYISNDRVFFDISQISYNFTDSPNITREYLEEVYWLFIANILHELGKTNIPQKNIILEQRKVNLIIITASNDTKLTWDTDESYTLNARTSGNEIEVVISAITVYGARHGIESLSQLIVKGLRSELIMPAQIHIKDKPMYKHRGLLLDTARNFIPISSIERTLDGMASSKLNIFHWHATDTQSFPLEITRLPQMHNFGAYSSSEIYSNSDIKRLIEYARFRGIRVLLELDAPSHSGNGWQWGPQQNLGDLAVCVNQQPWRNFCIQPPCGQLNPANPNLYDVIEKIFMEFKDILPNEETLHMGGDEVYFGCWNSSQEIIEFMLKKGLTTDEIGFLQIWSDFQNKVLNIWHKINNLKSNETRKQVILWSSHLTEPEVIENFLPAKDYIIQTWVEKQSSLNNELLDKGYKLIISTKDAWYLDHGFWGKTKYYDWRRVYSNTLHKHDGVLGGEACMWSEYVDENSLDSRIWPRAGALAERLWSNPSEDALKAFSRFYRYRERLVTRGINADTISPRWCVLNEGQC